MLKERSNGCQLTIAAVHRQLQWRRFDSTSWSRDAQSAVRPTPMRAHRRVCYEPFPAAFSRNTCQTNIGADTNIRRHSLRGKG